MKLNHETLRAVGEAMFGLSWHAPMAEVLSVSPRTVRRWANGTHEVPEGVWLDLGIICRGRGADLQAWADKLEVWHCDNLSN